MPETAMYIGAFVRWLTKLCKTKLRDELQGNLKPILLYSYSTENLFIGYIFVALILGTIILVAF